ncbi:hypothetical protein AB0N05_33280 [Nocardia sp. NPDC051030]|uniref:phthiocerol/phthiodiolone dimycocerosyl transferase family protein n=1 Tax=Nocardia sp. NPDC051030 TaxID=3155162 RepID=UPI0034499BED
MTRTRPLTPFELAHFDRNSQLGNVPKAEVWLYIGSEVRGEIDLDVLRLVLAELAAGHALLRSVVLGEGSDLRFEMREDYQPPLEVRDGGEDEYRKVVNTEQDWRGGLFKGYVIRGEDSSRVVIVAHHGICDGRSMFPLLGELWERYSAHLAGSPLPLSDSDLELPDGVDAQLANTVAEAEVDAFVGQLAAMTQATDMAMPAPAQLPLDGDGVGDPRGRFTLQSIELNPEDSAAVVEAARAHGFSVNSLISGAALMAVRGEIEADAAPAMMLIGHCADVRSELSPPIGGETLLNCVGGVPTPVFVSADADPSELAKMVEVGVRGGIDARFPALILRALSRGLDPVAAGMPAILPTLGLSNVGRLQAYPIPAELELVRNFVYAMGPGMPPAMTFYTIGDRLTIQVEYDTAEHSHAKMARVTEALREQLRALCGIAA